MRRRDFIAGLGGAAAGWPLAAGAQQPAIPVIGLLSSQSREAGGESLRLEAFHRGLAETGYVEGRNVAVEYRWAEGQNDRMPALAAELVRRRMAVIATLGTTPGALALKAATQTIPIVFMIGPDPVAAGLVASLNRPGGNLTGVTVNNVEVIAKRLELLHELVPAAKSIAFLINPNNPAATAAETGELQAAARVLGLNLLLLNASTAAEIETAFATLADRRAGALLVSGESFFFAQKEQLIALAARHAVPTIYGNRAFIAAGGLMSYGTDSRAADRLVGVYTGRILKGEKPADLPVQQATRIELAINLKTVKTLGLTVPQSILVRADEVIE
jgi:putative tryptophan/tyrosine transport system substrate-binding protein